MKKTIFLFPAVFLSFLLLLFPVHSSDVKYWTESERGDFERGTLQGVSLPGSGGITLSPRIKSLYEVPAGNGPQPFLWSQVVDSLGNIFVGTGTDGLVLKITRDGKTTPFFEAEESQVTALAMDGSENIYAGTSPQGKIYKISRTGKHEVFCEPEERYLWALAFDPGGNLFAATGERGLILAISKDGEYKIFFDSEESHIVSMSFDQEGNLLAGSDRKGIIYRITPDGKAGVLFAADKSEISSIAAGPDGTIYASALSHLDLEPPSLPLQFQIHERVPAAELERKAAESAMEEAPGKKFTAVIEGFPVPDKKKAPERPRSIIYAVSKEGEARPCFRSGQESIYALCAGTDGKIYFGTGEPGRVYRLEEKGTATLLHTLPEAQVTSLVPYRNSGLSTVTSNMGNAYLLSPELESSGVFLSSLFDTGMRSEWGKMTCRVEQKDGTRVELYTRSGNTEIPDSGWSDWSRAYDPLKAEQVQSPPARFIQWKAQFSRIDPGRSAILYSVTIPYLLSNAAPEIQTLSILKTGQSLPADPAVTPSPASPEKASRKIEKGETGILWQASDRNGDPLLVSLYYRSEHQNDWTRIDEVRSGNSCVWNHRSLPDGLYRIKIKADDSPSNFGGEGKYAELQSEPLLLDSTPPEMKVARKSSDGEKFSAELTAKDASGNIQKLLYSTDQKIWSLAKPDDRICDSHEESFHLSVEMGGSDRLYLKCLDDSQNESTLEIAR